jgi:hypothetical protein
MRLVLSSEAAPDLDSSTLVEVAARRGFSGVELVAGHAHGVDPHRPGGWNRCSMAVAFRAGSAAGASSPEAAALSATLNAPIVAPACADSAALALEVGETFATAGGELLIEHGSDPATVAALRQEIERAPVFPLGLAWEIDPEADDLSVAREILRAAGPHLKLIRLRGGGPEAARQEGLGVGALMAHLTLARFSGSFVLSPSEARFHYVWSAWLGRTGGWGCGSKTADDSLVQLNT